MIIAFDAGRASAPRQSIPDAQHPATGLPRKGTTVKQLARYSCHNSITFRSHDVYPSTLS
jgi:hypothetical protein